MRTHKALACRSKLCNFPCSGCIFGIISSTRKIEASFNFLRSTGIVTP